MERSIGRIEGKLDALIEDHGRSRQDRRQQYEKLEDLERLQSATAQKLQSVIVRLEKVEPVISKFNNWEQRGIGVLMFLGAISASFGASVAILWKKLAVWLGV